MNYYNNNFGQVPLDLFKDKKVKLETQQESWELYAPIIMFITAALGSAVVWKVSKAKGKSAKEDARRLEMSYNLWYPMINSISLAIPAYFAYQTIKFKKLEKL
jgi:hypothetical protein